MSSQTLTASEKRTSALLERYAERARRVWYEYGKIGVLVDDSRDADLRLSRELYGAESLRRWWLVARSAECAELLAKAVLKVLPDRSKGALGAIMVVDNYLPRSCENELDRPQPIRGSELEKILLRGIGSRRITTEGEVRDAALMLSPLTSFPRSVSDRENSGLQWSIRGLESSRGLRRVLSSTPHRGLLHYGPYRAGSEDPTEKVYAGEAGWYRRRKWANVIGRIASALKDRRECVLLTGAGASYAESYYGCGMPPTWWVLNKAGSSVADNRHDYKVDPVPAPHCWGPCICKDAAGKGSDQAEQLGPPKNVDALLKALRTGKGFADPLLEELFSEETNKSDLTLLESFASAFRQILHKYDHRFPYHTWLLARLPWSAIITTNYDRFHERAAASVAEMSGHEGDTLSRGAVMPDSFYDSEEGLGDLRTTHRLFKPYGSLHSPTDLVLGADQLENTCRKIMRAIESTLSDGALLVVVGHAVRDKSIRDAFEKLHLASRRDVVWVSPSAYEDVYEAEALGDGRIGTYWSKMMKQAKDTAGPLPGTALEFAYDLWMEYSKPTP